MLVIALLKTQKKCESIMLQELQKNVIACIYINKCVCKTSELGGPGSQIRTSYFFS